ncbi:SHOCT domain-containing protein [Halomicrococcus sp. NG-SE-24]|uniref:SHOCT domain-containing protein n=1 Tax=Halomicrococcus sp. NG-SE-24 TaxID=3436928 RepID=UPI003D99C459
MTLLQQLRTRIVVLITTATTSVATTTGTALADPVSGGHMWGGGNMWGDGWMTGFGWMGLWGVLWMLLLVALPIALVYFLTSRREPQQGTDTAVAALRERYARGEINDEEFETHRAKLARRNNADRN